MGNRKIGRPLLFALLLIFGFCLSLLFGRFPVFEHGLQGLLQKTAHPVHFNVFWNIRFPRTLASFSVGGMLGISGCVLQGVFRNPLVAPDILGVSSGASFGAAVAVVYFGARLFYTQLFAFTGAMVSIGMILLFAKAMKSKQVVWFVLAGILVNGLMQAGTTLMKYLADPYTQLATLEYWLMGSFNNMQTKQAYGLFAVAFAGFLLLYRLRFQVNLLSLGDEEAALLGVKVKQVRSVFVVAIALLVAIAVSFCGIIGWVGLISPHFARLLVGENHARTIPISFFVGSFLLLVADTVARSLFLAELPVGVVTSFLGAPVFAFLLWKVGGKE